MEKSKDLSEVVNANEFHSDSQSDEEEQQDDDEEACKCLFCSHCSKSVETCLKHIEDEHKLSFAELKAKFQMDQYSFIKLINCIRRENIHVDAILCANFAFWEDEKYLKPIEYEYTWLCYDYELLEPSSLESESPKDDTKLLINALQEKVRVQEELLNEANEHMSVMRKSFKRLMDNETKITVNDSNSVLKKSLESDQSYFSSYAHFSIHHEMLSDKVRTESYRAALIKNKEFVKNKDVLDVGCGTSILSIFASQAGAKNVVGIDNSDIIYDAMDIVRDNGVENVRLVKGRLEDTELPMEKYDIIISEWMGYFLLFEGMLDTVIYARDRHLKPDGILMPNRCTLNIVGFGDENLFKKYVTFWENVYGINMTKMRHLLVHEPLVEIVASEHVLTDAEIIANLDLMHVNLNYSNFSHNFNLKCLKDGLLYALVGYFDTFFSLPTPVMFSTSPMDPPTHWKQVVFFIEKPIKIAKGDTLSGSLTCRRLRGNARSLDITIEISGNKFHYYLD